MLDNLLEKSREDYEKQEAIKQKAKEVVDGKTDAFDALTDGVKNFSEPLLRNAVQKNKETIVLTDIDVLDENFLQPHFIDEQIYQQCEEYFRMLKNKNVLSIG